MSSSRDLGPSPDGRHDDLLPEDLDGLTLHVPDDPRELASDRAAWLAEDEPDDTVAGPVRRSPWRAASASHADRRLARRRRLSLTAGVVLASMLVVAVSGAVGAWIVGPQAAAPPGRTPGQRRARPRSGRRAAARDRPAGRLDARRGPLACVRRSSPWCPRSATSAPSCSPARRRQVGLVRCLAGGRRRSAAGRPARRARDRSSAPTRLATLTDPTNGLRGTYGLTGVTLLLVRDDGVVVDIVRNPAPDTHSRPPSSSWCRRRAPAPDPRVDATDAGRHWLRCRP